MSVAGLRPGVQIERNLRERIISRQAHLGVIGLGYVGLPLAMTFSRAGFSVDGIDIDVNKVQAINEGRSPIGDVSDEALLEVIERNKFRATADTSTLSEADVIFICVPTPINRTKEPDLSYVISASELLARHLRGGQLVILESTTYPGTTEEVVLPIIERSGLCEGEDFYLAFSPERVDPGNPLYRTENTPKVVGGVSPLGGELTQLLYAQIVSQGSVSLVSSTRTAEMTKLLENTFRAVNIALVNELALLCARMGIDVWEVIDAASTKPFGYTPFFPGPGVGGHCIPVDPYYLSWKAKEYDFNTKFIELAAETNGRMPNYVVDYIVDVLNRQGKALQGSKILSIGASFKANVEDARNSPAVKVMGILRQKGAEVSYHDPFVPTIDLSEELPEFLRGDILESRPLSPEILASVDVVVVLVNHSNLNWNDIVRYARCIVDTRNVVRRVVGDKPHVHVLWGNGQPKRLER